VSFRTKEAPLAGFSEPRDIIDALAVALNGMDANGVGELFTADGEFVNVRGTVMVGRQGIIEGHALSFSGPLAGCTFMFDSITELPVTADVTLLHAHCLRDRLRDAPATTAPAIATVLQLVARRGNEGWQAVAAANVPETPPPPGPSRR
jgi:uncharacterized protein (TIGR02246 family)